jgi:hypothetical protein
VLGWLAACAATVVPCALIAQGAPDVSLEYRVKAAYLFNFAKFIEWPPPARSGPLTICVAGRNVFGDVLEQTIAGEAVDGRPLTARVILEPMDGCHILFVPQGAAETAYLRTTQDTPVLTVGETPGFVARGGVANFVLEGGRVRFEIDPGHADRAGLRISSRLLRLARVPGGGQ